MNEIEIQKQLIKEAFNKEITSHSQMFGGGLDEESAQKLRNYIWKVCGYLEHQNPQRGYDKAKQYNV